MQAWWQGWAMALQHGSAQPLFFTSLLFVVVFTAFYGLQWGLARWQALRVAALLLFSLYFYYKAAGAFVLLLAATALVDYLLAGAIYRCRNSWEKDAWLLLSVSLNLGLLLYFKYLNFLLQSWHLVSAAPGPAPALEILLPVGISFYTFKSLGYLLDVRREVIERPEQSYWHYLLYVSFFPSILAGPITPAAQFLPQLRLPYQLNAQQLGRGIGLFVTGLLKKSVADYLAINFVDRVYDNPGAYTGLENLLASYGYGLQLYLDFSGYTNMALGIALLVGFSLGGNFNEPFKARNVGDFWRRWHISLSQWFNNYVFLPLSFYLRRWGRVGIAVAVLATFLLSGLWHGAAITFVLWGLAHGLAIAWETLTLRPRQWLARRWPAVIYNTLSTLLTLQFLAFTYVLFRSKSLAQASLMVQRMLQAFHGELAWGWLQAYAAVAALALVALLLIYLPTRWKHWLWQHFSVLPWPLQALLAAIGVVLAYQVSSAALVPFVYLQF